jgi:type IV pilus assembly protein PilC
MVLDQLASYQEKMLLLRTRLQKALFYPSIVLIVALFISMGLILFIVPQFEQLFRNVGANLPWLTRWVIYCAEIIKNQGIKIILILCSILLMIYFLTKRYIIVKLFFEKLALKIPVWGLLQRQAIMSRVTRTLAMTCHASVPLVDALLISADVAGQSIYRFAMLRVREAVMKGETLAHALQATRQFSSLIIQMVRVGEQAGALDKMLIKTADWLDQQIDYTVTTLSQLLEPFIMIFLGVLIGGLVLAMYLPVFQLGTVI